jgi:signal peptidase I
METTEPLAESPEAPESGTAPSEQERAEKRRKQVREWFKAFFIALACFILLRMFVFDINEVRGSSMEPALIKADKVFIDKISMWTNMPARGDIVVFRKPGENKRLIKRVIACPGDSIAVTDGKLVLNGNISEEPYVLPENRTDLPDLKVEGEVLLVDNEPVRITGAEGDAVYALDNPEAGIIPDGFFLVLGDNRKISLDSRNWGLLPASQIIGRARFRFRLYPPFIKTVK